MQIQNLKIHHCRIIEKADFELSEKINIFIGDNGSGKTSLIEAISILSTGRSFRTPQIKKVIKQGNDSIILNTTLKDRFNRITIGIKKNNQITRIRINQSDINRQSILTEFLPVTIIHPESVALITGASATRRSYIDWLAFYLYPEFKHLSKQYQLALKQRNRSLRDSGHHYAIKYWTEEIVKNQSKIHDYRSQALKLLASQISYLSDQLNQTLSIKIQLKSGFPVSLQDDLEPERLLNFYNEKRDYDVSTGRTNFGVHRSDLNVFIKENHANQFASRGQLKLIVFLLLIAQSNVIQTQTKNSPVILIDDLPAELDSTNQQALLEFLTTLDQQLLLTSTQSSLSMNHHRMFHVKHGTITEA